MHTKDNPTSASKNLIEPAYSKARPLAARLGVSPKTLFRWAAAGHISTFRVNRRTILFDPSEALAFVAGARVGPQKPTAAVAP
jgi:hypothetical protein